MLNLHYTDSGAAGRNSIIFLHAFPFNQSMWEKQVTLCEPQFRVVTYDHRGQGKSESGSGHFMFEYFVDDLFNLMDKLEIAKAVLCGLSMGGYVALRAAEVHPDRVQALILSDTRSEADSDATKLKRANDLRLLQDQGLEAFAEKFINGAMSPAALLGQPSLKELARRMILKNSPEGVQSALIALATRTDTTAFLPTIRVPTLILVGEQDTITPLAAAASMHERIPRSLLAVIPEAGHLSNLENPQAFNAQAGAFLNTLLI